MSDPKCGRCSSPIGDGWENGWPLYGQIDLGYPSQAFGALCGMKITAEPHHFRWWRQGYPAMTVNDAQRVKFEWSDQTQWRLCQVCQEKLLRVIGEFFGIPAAAEAMREKVE